MSSVSREIPNEKNDHCSHFSIHEDDNADQHEEYQSTCSELPAEIPDSQPDPCSSYLPTEIPDSQPDSGYRGEPEFSEVSSQLPTRDSHLVDAQVFDLRDYDLREQGPLSPSGFNRENIDPRLSRFDGLGREKLDDSDHDKADSNPSSRDTEIIPGGTRLTERRKDLIVSLDHHFPLPIILLSIFREVLPVILNAVSCMRVFFLSTCIGIDE